MSGFKRPTESHPNEESAEKDSEDVCEENKQTEMDDNKIVKSETTTETKLATRSIGTQYDLLDMELESFFESVEFPIENDFRTNLVSEFKKLLSKKPLIDEILALVLCKKGERAALNYTSTGISLDDDEIFCVGVLDIVDTFPKDMREETVFSMLDWLQYLEKIYTMTSTNLISEDIEQNLDD